MTDRTTEPASSGASAAAVRALVRTFDGPGLERQVSTDQANLSIAVDERYLVKWLREPLDASDLVTMDRLRSAGFRHMPVYVGAVAEDDVVRALVHELVPNATDGWQWYVDDVLRWIDRALSLEPLVETAARMGAITAELHHALALDEPTLGSIDGVRDRIVALSAEAFGSESIEGEPAARLAARRVRIAAALAPLNGVESAVVQPVHGDLHVGQFLRSGDRLLVIDFDGDPMVASDARLALQPVERDLAGLVQSLDHVARVAAKRRPGADVEPFIDAAIDACLRAYRAVHVVDDRMLWPLRVAQELHEYVYAVTRLPVWLYVPDAAIARLFP